MASFQLKESETRWRTEDMARYINKFGSIINSAESVRNRLETDQVYVELQNAINTLYSERDRMSEMREALLSVLNQYSNTERKILNNANTVVGSGNASGNTSTDGNGGTSSGETEDDSSLVKTILKTIFDVGGEFGSIGKTGSIFKSLFQMIIDGDEFTTSDIGAFIKNSGDTTLGIADLIEHYNGNDWKEMLGIKTYKGFSVDAQAGWATNMKNTALESFDDQYNVFKTGTREVDCPKVAGWALSLVANGFSNAEECQSGEIGVGRAVVETISETIIDVGKGAALTVGIAAGLAAIGVSAPAVVVAGAGVVISAGMDFICQKLTNKSVTEFVSDGILDTAAKEGEAITGAISSVGEAISGWWNKVKLAW